jgi:DNA primase
MNGTSIPETIVELCKKKVVTVFVDGDRGGNLIIKELSSLADIDYVAKAPDGKEVEEITKKEIHKAIRSRISGEQAKLEFSKDPESRSAPERKPQFFKPAAPQQPRPPTFNRNDARSDNRNEIRNDNRNDTRNDNRTDTRADNRTVQLPLDSKQKFKDMLENLIGTRGAQVLDQKLSTLGKVPISELSSTIKSLNNTAYAVIFDGVIDRDLAKAAESANVKFLVGMDSKIRPGETRVQVLTVKEL